MTLTSHTFKGDREGKNYSDLLDSTMEHTLRSSSTPSGDGGQGERPSLTEKWVHEHMTSRCPVSPTLELVRPKVGRGYT